MILNLIINFINQQTLALILKDLDDDTFNQIITIVEKFQDTSVIEAITKDLQSQDGSRHQSLIQLQDQLKMDIERSSLTSKRSSHDLSNKFFFQKLTTTPGRVDAINLKQGLMNQLQQITQQSQMNVTEKYQKADEILNQTLNELIRQVSFSCVERGQLIHSIFKGYLVLLKKIYNNYQKDQHSSSVMQYKLELELQNMYNGVIDEKDKIIEGLKQQMKEQDLKFESLRQQIDNIQRQDMEVHQKNEKIHIQRMDHNKTIQKQAVIMIKNLQREVNDLRGRLEKLRLNLQNYTPLQAQRLQEVPKNQKYNLSLPERVQMVDRNRVDSEYSPQVPIYDKTPRSIENKSPFSQKFRSSQNNLNNPNHNSERDGKLSVRLVEIADDDDDMLQNILKESEKKIPTDMNKDIIVKDFIEEPPKVMYSKEMQTIVFNNSTDAASQSDLQLIHIEYDRLMHQKEIDEQLKEVALKDQILEFTHTHLQTNEESEEKGPTININTVADQPNRFSKQNLQAAQVKMNSSRSNTQKKTAHTDLARIINSLPGSVEQIRQMEKADMLDLFINNVNLLRIALDKEEIPITAPTQQFQHQIVQSQFTHGTETDDNQEPSQFRIEEQTPQNERIRQRFNRESSLEIIAQENDVESSPEVKQRQINRQQSQAIALKVFARKTGPRMSVNFPIERSSMNDSRESKQTIGQSLGSRMTGIQINTPKNNPTPPKQNQSPLVTPKPSQTPSAGNIQNIQTSFPQNFSQAISQTALDKNTPLNTPQTPIKKKSVELLTQNLPVNPPQQIQKQTYSSKFGLAKNDQVALKTQLTMLIMIHNMQVQKNHNLQKQIQDLIELMRLVFNFAYKLMMHIINTQKLTHKEAIEAFVIEYETLRGKLPRDFDNEIRNEDWQEEDEEVKKEKLRQQNIKNAVRKTRRITKALEFNFSRSAIKQPSMVDKLSHPGILICLKVKEQYHQVKKNINFWPVRNVLKTITQLYDEKIRQEKDKQVNKDQEMQIFIFNNFLNRYGFKTVAEKKYLQFLCSVLNFNTIFRINVFSRTCCILGDESINFNTDETSFFLQGLDYMNRESTLGQNIVQSEGEQKFYVPYLRALDYMEVHLENKLLPEELKEIRADLESLKENDPKNQNKAGIIDVDIFLVKVINKYRATTNRTKQFVIHAFQAADLDGNKKINVNEFTTLFRHIEPTKFDPVNSVQLFDDSADIITENDEKNLSFEKFTAVCVNQQIFSEQSLNKFIGIENEKQLEDKFADAKLCWTTYKRETQATLEELEPFVTGEIHETWRQILDALEERMNQQVKPNQMKPILIAHKVLTLELARLVSIGHMEEDEEEDD